MGLQRVGHDLVTEQQLGGFHMPWGNWAHRLQLRSLHALEPVLRNKRSEVKLKSLSHVQLFGTPWTVQSMQFSRPEYWSRQPFPSPGDLPNPGIESRSPALQADSLPPKPKWKPKNTWVGSLSLLPQINPTQELNWGLLHCRWILYQLSYQGSQKPRHCN